MNLKRDHQQRDLLGPLGRPVLAQQLARPGPEKLPVALWPRSEAKDRLQEGAGGVGGGGGVSAQAKKAPPKK